jgi:predicted anti-sigma-YlaC factor YlaD
MVELMSDYLEGAMAGTERARFEAHLAICEGCERFLHQIRETVRVTGRLTEDGLPGPIPEELLTAFRGWKQQG